MAAQKWRIHSEQRDWARVEGVSTGLQDAKGHEYFVTKKMF